MGQLCPRQDKQEKDIEYLKKELSQIKAGLCSGSSSWGISRSTSSTIRHSLFEDHRKVKADEKTDIDDQYSLPVVRRRVLAIGGYPEEMVKEELEAAFKVTFISALGEDALGLVEEIRAPYKLGSLLKLVCHNTRRMWKVLTSMKGRKFIVQREGAEVRLWHGIDRSPEERLFGKRVARASTLIKEYLISTLKDSTDEDIGKMVHSDAEKGAVWTKVPGKHVQRVFTRASCTELQVHDPYLQDNVAGFVPSVYFDELNTL